MFEFIMLVGFLGAAISALLPASPAETRQEKSRPSPRSSRPGPPLGAAIGRHERRGERRDQGNCAGLRRPVVSGRANNRFMF